MARHKQTVSVAQTVEHERDCMIEVRVAVPGQPFSAPVLIRCVNARGAMLAPHQTVERYVGMLEEGLRAGIGDRVSRG